MRSALDYWLIVLGMGAITLGTRMSMLIALDRTRMTPGVTRGLRLVPAAVFSALIAPALLRPHGPLDLSVGNPYLLAGVAAALVAWRWRSMLATVAVGMLVLFALR